MSVKSTIMKKMIRFKREKEESIKCFLYSPKEVEDYIAEQLKKNWRKNK